MHSYEMKASFVLGTGPTRGGCKR